MSNERAIAKYPALVQTDDELLKTLFGLLSDRVKQNPYAQDCAFATEIRAIPVGLRAMAATHWLDISLTLDWLCYHFRNFGEPQFVVETEAGLRELGLLELARLFHEAFELMLPLQDEISATGEFDDTLAIHGVLGRAEELDRLAHLAHRTGGNHAIYSAWLCYARRFPGRVFVDGVLQ